MTWGGKNNGEDRSCTCQRLREHVPGAPARFTESGKVRVCCYERIYYKPIIHKNGQRSKLRLPVAFKFERCIYSE